MSGLRGMPVARTRWTAQQRADRLARVRVVRWLWENALVDHRTIQRAMDGQHNATLDLAASGASPRWWLNSWDIARQNRHLDGEFYRPGGIRRPRYPRPESVIPPEPPRPSPADALRWMAANSAESVKALAEAAGLRFNVKPMAARRRGTKGWSLADLDRIFPDLTAAPP